MEIRSGGIGVNDNNYKRWIVMNTTSAPSTVQGKVVKIVEKRIIDLNTIEPDEEIKFEDIMREENSNDD